jgi:hypothetical protein
MYAEIEPPMDLPADVWKTRPVMKVASAKNIRTEITQKVMGQTDEFIYAHKAAVKDHPQAKSSDVNDVNSVTAVKNPSQQPTQTTAKFNYVASKNSKVFHNTNCSMVNRITPGNIIGYNTRDEAINTGKRPCKLCNP